MADSATILEWLKEAGAYAYECEDPERVGGQVWVDVVVRRSTVVVRAMRSGKQEYNSLTWSEIERAEMNPLTQLIDDTIAGNVR